MSALATWCARRRWIVMGAWVVALLALAVTALGVGAKFTDATSMPDSESGTAYSLMAEAGMSSTGESGNLVWHTDGTGVDDPAVRSTLDAALSQIAALPGVASVTSPYAEAGAAQLNAAANTAYATIVLSDDDSSERIASIADSLQTSTLDVAVGGTAFAPEVKAGGITEGIGVLAALVILLIVFRSVWAAILPILTGIAGVAVSLLTIMLLSNVVNLSATSITMAALVGLGVGIDYALFIVNRHRKALMAGKSVHDAVVEAVNTSGRAVIFAGLTVVIALIGVFVVGIDILTGMARGAALTVLVTVLAAITLLPALLSALGLRVLSKRQRRELAAASTVSPTASAAGHPAHSTHVAAGSERGAAQRWSALVERAPKRLAALGLIAMIVLALPAVSLRLGTADASSDPTDSATHQYYSMMSDGFGDGFDASLVLVAETPDAASKQALTTLTGDLASVADVSSVSAAPSAPGQAISIVTVTPSSSAQAESTENLVNTLRDDIIPAAESGTALQVHVGGATASSIDSSSNTLHKLPLFLGLVAALGFVLLVVAFRSVVVPLIGALGNLITLAVGLGVLVLAFQHGWLTSVLGVGSASPVESLVPVLVIGIMFGLSMDYQVFLVSRMHEEWHHTRDNARAVRVGLAETAKVIVTAAAIMFAVFASFGFAGQRIVAEIGVGLALAVLVDAFVLRLTVIPALMHLIGARNWSYPRWAERITPRVSIEGASSTEDSRPQDDTKDSADDDTTEGSVVPLSRSHDGTTVLTVKEK